MIYVLPKPGIKIRDDKTHKLIADEGEYVESSAFWIRRNRDGDCQILASKPEPITSAIGAPI